MDQIYYYCTNIYMSHFKPNLQINLKKKRRALKLNETNEVTIFVHIMIPTVEGAEIRLHLG